MAVVLVIGFLGTVEFVFRARGMTPQFQETPRHWAYWRAQANDDPDVLVLAGSSRFALGIAPEAVERHLPERVEVIQLALPGGSPLPVVRQLAEDEDFVGSVLVEAYPRNLFTDEQTTVRPVLEYVQFYERRSAIEEIEALMRAALQGSFVVARPEFRPTLFLVNLLGKGELPSEGNTRMHFDRWTAADYSKGDHTRDDWHIAESTISSPEAIEARFAALRRDVDKIRARGGNVVFFRMISSKNVREEERKTLPREEYWDRYSDQLGAPALHFEDFPEMREFVALDGSHLDRRHVEAFDALLADAVRRYLYPEDGPSD